jgi:sugar phosphate isomerase/epimerase
MPVPEGAAVATRRFGVSTHLFHGRRLERAHLAQIAAAGFDCVEVVAERSHFDYHAIGAIESLAGWLSDSGLRLHAIHAPVAEHSRQGRWNTAYANASIDPAVRRLAVQETKRALEIARQIDTGFLVLHLGLPSVVARPGQNNRDAAVRSLEEIHEHAAPLGVSLAIELLANELSSAAALVELIEDDLELPGTGVCLDFGHAHLAGDLVDAIETASGHVLTTHVHDNGGRRDDHLAPYAGTIDWPAALMAIRKVGYEGALIFEMADTGSAGAALEQAARARRRFASLLRD